MVQKLVATYEHVELSRRELDEFRESFGHHAFMCRFSSCSHGWSGLTNYQERCHHEATHSVVFSCPEPSCPYPPFGSRAALKRHQSQVHDKSRPKPRLRKSVPPTRPQPSRDPGAALGHPMAPTPRLNPLLSSTPPKWYHQHEHTRDAILQHGQPAPLQAQKNAFPALNASANATQQQQRRPKERKTSSLMALLENDPPAQPMFQHQQQQYHLAQQSQYWPAPDPQIFENGLISHSPHSWGSLTPIESRFSSPSPANGDSDDVWTAVPVASPPELVE